MSISSVFSASPGTVLSTLSTEPFGSWLATAPSSPPRAWWLSVCAETLHTAHSDVAALFGSFPSQDNLLLSVSCRKKSMLISPPPVSFSEGSRTPAWRCSFVRGGTRGRREQLGRRARGDFLVSPGDVVCHCTRRDGAAGRNVGLKLCGPQALVWSNWQRPATLWFLDFEAGQPNAGQSGARPLA